MPGDFNRNILNTIVVAHALDLKLNIGSETKNSAISAIPQGLFGVFVTVRRSASQSLPKWPKDIHGCIGWWQKSFSVVSQEEIYGNLLRVASDAVWEDHRRKYFKSLSEDADATIEIDFMNQHWPVDAMTGIIQNKNSSGSGTQFNNDYYGLIVTGDHSATYLPKVFDSSTSWQDFTRDLRAKANVSDSANVKYFAYNIIQYKKRLFDLIDQTFMQFLFLPSIYEFVNTSYSIHPEMPHSISKNGHVTYDQTDFVRNIATIYDLGVTNRVFGENSQLGLNETTMQIMRQDIVQAAKSYDDDPLSKEQRQASAFLLLAIDEFKMNSLSSTKQEIITRLYDAVAKGALSPEFERGEVLLALEKVASSKSDVLNREAAKSGGMSISIFQLNWEAQFVATHGGPMSRILELATNLLNQVETFAKNREMLQTESNYLAVGFEGLSCLYPLLNWDSDLQVRVKNSIMTLFVTLVKRRNANGFVSFLDGSARLDITGHFLQGFIAIVSNRTNGVGRIHEANLGHEGKKNVSSSHSKDTSGSIHMQQLEMSYRLKFDPITNPMLYKLLIDTTNEIKGSKIDTVIKNIVSKGT